MKKSFIVGAALLIALAGCSSNKAEETKTEATAEPTVIEKPATQEETTINWVTAASAEEAAKAAGFERFGVIEKITLSDMEFKDPTFSSAEGVARASYETGATGLYICKADGSHTAPLTERNLSDFAQKWTKSYEDLEVTLYGPAKGAATVITWTDGTQEFGVTFQGLGGEEMTLDSDEVAQIVKELKAANATSATTTTTQNTSTQENNAYIGEARAKEIAFNDCGENEANATSVNVELKVGGDAPHYVVVIVQGASTHTYEIDASTGDIWTRDVTHDSDTESEGVASQLFEKDAVALAEQVSGGEATTWYTTTSDQYGECWYVSCTDEAGNVMEYYVTADGSAYLIN